MKMQETKSPRHFGKKRCVLTVAIYSYTVQHEAVLTTEERKERTGLIRENNEGFNQVWPITATMPGQYQLPCEGE